MATSGIIFRHVDNKEKPTYQHPSEIMFFALMAETTLVLTSRGRLLVDS